MVRGAEGVNPWIGHAAFTSLVQGSALLRPVAELPASFDALLLDERGTTTKTRIRLTQIARVEPFARPLGPWVEELLGRRLTADECDVLEAGLREVAGLGLRADAEPRLGLDRSAEGC